MRVFAPSLSLRRSTRLRGIAPGVISVLAVLGWGFVPPLPGGPGFAAAQVAPPLGIEVRDETGGARVIFGPFLQSRSIRSALDSGLPIRIHLVTELWRERFFDAQEGRHEWRATVRFDPLSELYRVETGNGATGTFRTVEGAEQLLREAVAVPLRPPRSGRYYYLARLEVESLSPSDLEELRRWLQGDPARALEPEDPGLGGLLLQGVRRLFVRGLGLPVQRYQARSPRFDWGR
jgi:hypothetical protein